ncbi:MAG: aminodeoxychorismate synthase, component I, partial [Planctomycetaceae bacterium]
MLPLVEELTGYPDVADVLAALADQPRLIVLESTLQRKEIGRYSFLAADPFAFFTIPRVAYGESPFASLRDVLSRCSAETVAGLPPFQGGAAGLLSYELGQAWEQSPLAKHDEFQLPDLAVGIYDWVIAWDHESHRAWIVSQGFP